MEGFALRSVNCSEGFVKTGSVEPRPLATRSMCGTGDHEKVLQGQRRQSVNTRESVSTYKEGYRF
jgi:hypothetical protein